MKKYVIPLLAVLLALTVAVVCFSNKPVVATGENVTVPLNSNVAVALNGKDSSVNSKVLESRFLNMLNHNFVYGEDFNSVDAIVNDSVLALLDMRENPEDEFLPENIVYDYILDMYGVEISDFSLVNSEKASKQGYVYIIPRGYSEYKHSIISVGENEDGSYTVKTKTVISSHDGDDCVDYCTTLFVKNPNSRFGFNIISSDLGENSFEA